MTTEDVERWIAWHLPRRVVYWCMVRSYGPGFSVRPIPGIHSP
jgi:hypothetical protein